MNVTRLSSENLYAATDAPADLTTTTNDFVTVADLDVATLKTKAFWFTATTNTLSVKVLGSLDGGTTYPIEAEVAFDVTAAAGVKKQITDYYTNLRVQVAPKVADSHGTLATQFAGVSF